MPTFSSPGASAHLAVGGPLLGPRALNRTIWPKSKRAFAEWYEGTVLAGWCPCHRGVEQPTLLDHMHLFEAHHFAPIQRELLTRIRDASPGGAVLDL